MTEIEELEQRYEGLRADLIRIDQQLSYRRREHTLWDAAFRTWRRNTVHAKQAKTLELLAVKKQLLQLKGGTHDLDQAGQGRNAPAQERLHGEGGPAASAQP